MNAARKMMLLTGREVPNLPRMGGYGERVKHHPEKEYEPYNGGYRHEKEEHEATAEFEYPEGRRYKNGRFAPTKSEVEMTLEKDRPRQKMQIGFARGEDDEEEMPFSEMIAEKWVRGLENDDGTKGAHWSMEQVKTLMAQKGISGDPWEYWVALNVIYSDYGKVLRKYGVGDKIDLYVDLAKSFVDDKDAAPDKLARYYQYIVKH